MWCFSSCLRRKVFRLFSRVCVWKKIVIIESFDVGWYMALFGTLGLFVSVGGVFFLGGFC